MSSNPLGDAFYDEDDLSITSSAADVKHDPISDASSQPYLANQPPQTPPQNEEVFSPTVPIQRYEPDDRYVRPERKPRPAQAAPVQQAASPEPLATASASSGPTTRNFGSTPAKPAVIVTKTPPGQSKLSKARAAARRAAVNPSATSAETKLPELKLQRAATAMSETGERTALEINKSPRNIADHSCDDEAQKPAVLEIPKAKPKVSKTSTKAIDAILEVPVTTAAEQMPVELTEDLSKPEPYARRAKDKARLSSADKMRAQRGIRTPKANR